MPIVSNRGQHMPASPIRKLAPFAEAAVKKGIKVYHLNIGQPDIETPKAVLDAIKQNTLKIVSYTDSAGKISLREKMAQYYQRLGLNVESNDILITTGGSEAILLAFLSCLDPGDELIMPEPFYANYNGFARISGIRIIPIPSSAEEGFALPSIEKFEAKITEKTKGIFICNPNNPTGYLYSKEEIEKLGDLVKRKNLFLFSDEAYREFCYEGEHFSVLKLKDADQNVILLDTVSKRYSSCGTRIGALVTKNEAVREAVLKFAQARLCPPLYGQIAAEAAMDLPENYFDATREEYKKRRDLLVKRLNQIPGVLCPIPGGAFYAMARLPIDDAEIFCKWMLENFSFKGATVMMAPGSGFYFTSEHGKKEVRLAYVLKTEDIDQAMNCLEEGIRKYREVNNI